MAGTFFSWVSIVERALSEEGVDLRRELGQLGVTVPDSPDTRLDAFTTQAIWKVADRHSLPPAFGVRLARGLTYGDFEDLGIALAAASDLEHAVRHIVRYHRLLTDQVRVEVRSGDSRLSVRLVDEGLDHWRVHEFAAAIVVSAIRARFGRDANPVSVSLAVDSPEAQDAYQRYFKCPVTQRADVSNVVYAAEQPLREQTSDRPVVDRVESLLDAAYRDMQANATWSRRVHAAILRAPIESATSIDRLAAGFHISPRTLQRYLQDEGTSFRQILDTARKDLAMRLVREGILTISQVSDALGFHTSSAFSRSFRRWHGTSPSQARSGPRPEQQPADRTSRARPR